MDARKGAPAFSENTRMMGKTAILSLAAALSSIAFLLLTNLVFKTTFLAYAEHSSLYFAIASFLTIMLTSLISGFLLYKLSPDAAGSGIPQFKAAYWKDLGYLPIRPVLVKFAAGILSIGGGTSLGREGPTVFIGGGLSSWLSGFMGAPKQKRRDSALLGASAGLSAAFNTPLAALAFVLEEIVGDFNARFIGKVVLSSVIGAFMVYAIIGRQPSFILPSVDEVTWWHYLLVPVVAAAASFLGVIFQRSALALRARMRRRSRLPPWLRPATGAFATWVIGLSCFLATGRLGVFGLGYQDLSSVLQGNFAWKVAGLLVAAKLFATIASYGTGGCGGIFSPMLFIGGLSGFFIAGFARQWIPLNSSDLIVLAAVGMSACLGAVVRAPLSSLLIVFEMTHQFALVPGLLIGTFITIAVSKLAGGQGFYDALLLQDGHELRKIHPPLDLNSWESLPISEIANAAPVCAASLDRASLSALVKDHPYRRFPLLVSGRPAGILERRGIERALAAQGLPDAEPIVTCSPHETVRAAGERMVESHAEILALVDEEGKLAGIVTLHDILRAQAAIHDQ